MRTSDGRRFRLLREPSRAMARLAEGQEAFDRRAHEDAARDAHLRDLRAIGEAVRSMSPDRRRELAAAFPELAHVVDLVGNRQEAR